MARRRTGSHRALQGDVCLRSTLMSVPRDRIITKRSCNAEKAGTENSARARRADTTCTAIIIGAGITGIGAAYYLRAHNISYTILEGKDDLGGVWNTHRWHGARCDSDFIKYSFSFKPFLSPQCLQSREHIHQYLRSVATEFELLEHIRFNTLVTKAVFDIDDAHWIVHTNTGIFASQFLINGNGYFSNPYMPVFRNAETFTGEIIHTSDLDGRRTFTDKDVVLVGSGSTAICCAPELSRVSKSLVLIQRSPSYIYEISNKASRVTLMCQRLHEIGITFPVKVLRYYLQCKDDLIFVLFRRFPRFARWVFKHHWLKTIGEESFQRHFSPRYNPWEQRIAVAIGLKEKLQKKEISIKTGEIDHFTESSIVLTSGEDIRCDACILATGFDVNFLKFDMYVGEEKRALKGLNFYKGLMMGAVPNYFQPVGVWHSAWTQRSETATRFAIKIMTYMKRNGFRTVSIERKDVECSPGITPNYIKRCLSSMPRLYGTYNLPSIDNIVSYRFHPGSFKFS